jgi:hypothetical protein
MKRLKQIALIAAFGLTLGWIMGCGAKANPTTPAQLAPGYQNSADQQMGEILAGAHAFYNSIQQQQAAGQLGLTDTAKAAFNQFGTALNAAQTVYLAYHSGTATQAQAQTAVNQVQSQQAALPLPGAKP